MLAQDTKDFFPELVHHQDETDFYGISYMGLGVVAIKAIQVQQEIIDKQGELINELVSRIETLENAR